MSQTRFKLAPLALAATLTAGAPASALAQSAPAATAQATYAIKLPAQPLGDALNELARQAGLQLLVRRELVDGKHAPAVNGQLTAQQALDRVLAGSGLTGGLDGAVVVLKPAGMSALEPVLPTVSVRAETIRDGTTEGTGAYTTLAMNTSTKFILSPRETPQSVSVLTGQQIEDQGLLTLDDAVQSITGLTMQKGYYSGESGSFFARGFPISNLLLDGLPTSTGANGTFNADNDSLDIYDRVEVVRGATGLTTGAGTPSAAINLVRKRPTAENQASMTVSAGSWSNFRTTLDASGPLNESGTLRGRTVATVQDTRQFYDTAHDRNHQFYGIVEADLTPATVATLGLHYRNVDNDGYVPGHPTNTDGSFLSGLSRSANTANDFDYWQQTDQTIFADLSHKFGNGWRAKVAAVWKRPKQDMMYSGLYMNAGVLRQNTQRYRLDNRQDSYDLALNGPFSLLGRSHELMLGASYRQYDNKNWGGWASYSWTAAGPAVDPYQWDSSSVVQPDIDMSLWKIDTATSQKSLYSATRLNLADSMKLILGARVNWYENQNHQAGTSYKIGQEVTPYAGLVYDLNDQYSVYASWTEIFEPQGSYDQSGELLDPITGTNYELGVKGAYFGGRLNASLATFVVEQQNRAVDDLSGPNPCPGSTWGYCQRASGEVQSKGIELEISGALTPNWQIMAGYTYVAAKYTKDADESNIGELFDSDLPRHQFKLSTSYRLPGDFSRWRLGGNVYAQNSIKSSDDQRIQQSGYAIVGISGSYLFDEHVEVRLNINNLFDKHYYRSIGWTTGGNVFGAPRNVMLTAKYTF
jgi:outer-membrane receptor for ferric coprogen and ferric-rhodotorulic acid